MEEVLKLIKELTKEEILETSDLLGKATLIIQDKVKMGYFYPTWINDLALYYVLKYKMEKSE
jgi:hypothetical protein